MYSTQLIADYIIAHGGGALTPLQVIKLTYITHGFTLALLGRPLVPEAIEAWKYGPVIPSIYNTLKVYGGSPIPSLSYCDTGIDTNEIKERNRLFKRVIPQEERAILNRVLELYGDLTGIDLLKLTHKRGSPWSKHYKKDKLGTVIPNETIKEHYKKLVSDDSPS